MVGNIGQADPDFGAIEDIVVAVLASGGRDVARVGACARLGEAEGCQLLASRLRDEVFLLLLFGAPLQKAERVEADMHALDDAESGLCALDLFADQAEGDIIEARAAILFGDGATQQAKWRPSS